ncbi:hypothetical protein F4679DRAFT_555735 [Xylaria curta]|nr:hypothetical protein F4679DRAFT_555735 [Xylaria curta]
MRPGRCRPISPPLALLSLLPSTLRNIERMWHQLRAVLLLVAVIGMGTAQRPSNATICDYYAMRRFGENSSDTQFMLMQSIVALAFGGGATLPNASGDSTGILNPGSFNGLTINLRPWFDGSKATTNLNNQAIGINWLDDGAQEPLTAFLNGTTDNVELDGKKNEYRLFAHFYSAFGKIYGCTLTDGFPKANDSGNPISPAYVHKFMNLNQTDLGHFIDQLILSSEYYGFSQDDASTLSAFLNSRYNVRCAPAINGQLYSICQAPECPLAAPSPDCDAYVNVGPGENSTGSGGSGTAPGGPSQPTSSTTSTFSSEPTTSSPSSTATSSGAALSSGAIAGIAIGGAVVALLALGLWLYHRRWQKSKQPQMVAMPYTGGSGHLSPSSGHHPHPSYTPTLGPHTSYTPSSAPRDSHLTHGSFFEPKQPEAELGVPTPVVPHSPSGMMHIAELESPMPSEVGGTVLQGRFGESANTWGTTGR